MTDRPIVRARAPLPAGRRWALRGMLLLAVLLSPYIVTSQQPKPALGVSIAGLTACPQSPRCVSSDFLHILYANTLQTAGQRAPHRPSHFVEPIELQVDAQQDWQALVETVQRQPGVKIVEQTDYYLRAERSTTIYGLIDDFELARAMSHLVLVRSSARIGYSDFGRNRRFVERIRAEFQRNRPATVGDF